VRIFWRGRRERSASRPHEDRQDLEDAARGLIAPLKQWMGTHNAAVMTVLCLVTGAKRIGEVDRRSCRLADIPRVDAHARVLGDADPWKCRWLTLGPSPALVMQRHASVTWRARDGREIVAGQGAHRHRLPSSHLASWRSAAPYAQCLIRISRLPRRTSCDSRVALAVQPQTPAALSTSPAAAHRSAVAFSSPVFDGPRVAAESGGSRHRVGCGQWRDPDSNRDTTIFSRAPLTL
jgi:hypothetical protein